MCALIAMAIYSTESNKKDECLVRTLQSLEETLDTSKHRLYLSVNGCTSTTIDIMNVYRKSGLIRDIVHNESNIGTAEAINKVWKLRNPGENAVKMDDDVEINYHNWIGEMEEAIARQPLIGQCGLKRKDCIESPDRLDFYGSKLVMLPHKPGEKWIIAEEVNHVMGTCQMYSSALLDKIGYLYQPRLYGFDDALASARSRIAGFINVFLPYIDIDHIDKGDTSYQKWKEKVSGEDMAAYSRILQDYQTGKTSIYYNPFEK